jgi:hypothetical protein
MDNTFLISLSLFTFIVGYLLSTLMHYRYLIKRLKSEIENRKLFLDRVFYLIQLNESIDMKLYFDQALQELKEENKSNLGEY